MTTKVMMTTEEMERLLKELKQEIGIGCKKATVVKVAPPASEASSTSKTENASPAALEIGSL